MFFIFDGLMIGALIYMLWAANRVERCQSNFHTSMSHQMRTMKEEIKREICNDIIEESKQNKLEIIDHVNSDMKKFCEGMKLDIHYSLKEGCNDLSKEIGTVEAMLADSLTKKPVGRPAKQKKKGQKNESSLSS